ncbi:MAG: VWA domain-containing protein [Acidobacteria bacterium]|nr:VWA domain-containing protein [Acidobacteriota bacterium]
MALASAVCLVSSVPTPRQTPVFRTGIDLVNLGVTVTDKKGNLVTDLKAEDFEIGEDGRRQTVRYFSAGAPTTGEPPFAMHLGLLLDVSESMGEDMRFSKTASIKFLNMLSDAVDITVVDFDTEVRTARYGQREFARLIERIRQKTASGNTALYDAIGTYLDGAAGQDGRKIMLLYTDGGDTQSSLGFGELMNLLKASDVTVYAIGELEHQSQSTKMQQRMLLQQIADVTGGQAFFPTAVKELDAVYAKVLAEIRAQYTIGYLSTNEKTDGSWRKVDVKVVRKDGRELRLRARKGYFAPYKR